jgi:hypothetical protein
MRQPFVRKVHRECFLASLLGLLTECVSTSLQPL